MSEDLSAQLVSCRVRLAEAQRSAELLQGRVATLEEQLSDAQHARCGHGTAPCGHPCLTVLWLIGPGQVR